MRTKLNFDSSIDRSVESSLENSNDRQIVDKLAISGMPISGMPLPNMPLEWLDAGSWRLPSGKALAEFALQAGFLAPLLLNGEKHRAPRSKQCAKGSGQ